MQVGATSLDCVPYHATNMLELIQQSMLDQGKVA